MSTTLERNGPPEDCGGIFGYTQLLKVMSDPSHPNHESTKEWVGEGFEPEWFDLNEINETLKDFDDEVAAWEEWANGEDEVFE